MESHVGLWIEVQEVRDCDLIVVPVVKEIAEPVIILVQWDWIKTALAFPKGKTTKVGFDFPKP